MTAILTKAQTVSVQTLLQNTNLVQTAEADYHNIYNQIWNIPANTGYTTADVLAALGNSAASVLANLATMATFITAMGGTVPVVTGAKAYTVHDDGTVTLS